MSMDKLHCFPHDDLSFRTCAETLLTTAGSPDPRALQQQLRRSYPKAVVRKQHPLATLMDGPTIWYVYRDGRYVTAVDEEMAAPVDAA